MLGMLAGRLLNAWPEIICNASDDVLCIEGKVDLGRCYTSTETKD